MAESNGITLSRGTTTNPTIGFVGDENTGINSATAGVLQLVADGTAMVQISTTGVAITSARVDKYYEAAGSESVTASQSGTLFVDLAGSGSTVFSLPATVEGLRYTFYCGDAASEITIRPVAADKIMGKGITATDDRDYVNTGGTNAVGDLVTIVGDGVDGWYVVAERGIWARE